jgi:hypothetical protein
MKPHIFTLPGYDKTQHSHTFLPVSFSIYSVAGDACQYKASDECERITGGSVPNGAQFCVNGGTCEQELSSGTTYCKCSDEFGGNQCEAPKAAAGDTVTTVVEQPAAEQPAAEQPAAEQPAAEQPVASKTNADNDLAASLTHNQNVVPTPAPTAEDTIQDTEMDQSPVDGTEPDPADDPAKFFNLDFPIMSSSNNKGGEAAKTESATHHKDSDKSSNKHHTDKETHKKEEEQGMSAPAQFGIFILLAGFLSVLAVAVYRRHRRQKFGKEKSRNIHNANLHYVEDPSSAAGADGANVYRDEIYKNAIFDADGKVEAVEIL